MPVHAFFYVFIAVYDDCLFRMVEGGQHAFLSTMVSVLFQVVEGMMCMFQGALTSKTISYEDINAPHTVSGDMQCRTCWNSALLLQHGCVEKGYTCK